MVRCPVCRAEVHDQARRCFLDGQCPVCLATGVPLFILACGHAVCEGDLAGLGLVVEKPVPPKPARRVNWVPLARAAVQPCISLGFLYIAWTQPGAPMQLAYRFVNFLFDGDERICVDTCFGAREKESHQCHSHCECDGARSCSFFGYCVGDMGDCGLRPVYRDTVSWSLNASSPQVARVGRGPTSNEHRLNVSRIFWSKKPNTEFAWASGWSKFSLGGLPGLSLQIRSTSKQNWDHASVRLRGPGGHFIRSKVSYFGQEFEMPHLQPCADAHGQDKFLGNFDAESCLAGDFRLKGCIQENSTNLDACGRVTLELLEVRYVPTFTSDGRDTSKFGVLSRQTSLAMPFDVSGIGRLFLRIFPAGYDGPTGRCSAFLIGTSGVAADYILRIGHSVLGTLKTPLHCPDIGKGCWLQDAGPSWKASRWQSVAVSLVSIMPRSWQAVGHEGEDDGVSAQHPVM